jgi:hypothetical protein
LKQLKEIIDGFTESLRSCEETFRTQINEIFQISLIAQMDEYCLIIDDDKQLVEFISPTILVENYVSLRILLRRVVDEVERRLLHREKLNLGQNVHENQWSEFIDDLWTAEDKLKHFNIKPDLSLNAEAQKYGLVGTSDDEVKIVDESNIVEKHGPTELSNEEISDTSWHATAKRLTEDDIVDYLHSIKCDKYSAEFRDNGINGNVMLDLVIDKDHESLEEIGVGSKLQRKKILAEFEKYVVHSYFQHGLEEV